ncbi:MAG: DM13 domain-containing protein [Woeseiaceae bacterium]|nr:DM13 domain-containing protein [Woeseiaceae bacterium]
MNKPVVIVLLVVLLVGGWFFVSPLFIDRTVDEPFDAAGDAGIDIDAIMAMPEDERMAVKDDIMNAAAGAADSVEMEEMPRQAASVLARGTFVDADAIHKGSGTATLYGLPDDSHVLRFEDFRTTNGPALVVYLAKHPSPASASDVTDFGFLSLGKLKGNVGNQNYPLPAGTNVADYNSVVIWCELFDVLFSPAALRAP